VHIEELNQEIRKYTKCRLSEKRNCSLFGEGKMFIGPSGKMLDDLFETIGIDRKNIYMSNLILNV